MATIDLPSFFLEKRCWPLINLFIFLEKQFWGRSMVNRICATKRVVDLRPSLCWPLIIDLPDVLLRFVSLPLLCVISVVLHSLVFVVFFFVCVCVCVFVCLFVCVFLVGCAFCFGCDCVWVEGLGWWAPHQPNPNQKSYCYYYYFYFSFIFFPKILLSFYLFPSF